MKALALYTLLFFVCVSQAQIISQFTWDTNPVSNSIIGPNASSISSSATSSPNGVGGTNGLNAGLPKKDINMIIPNTGGIFDVDGIHVEFDFQRDESSGTFVKRGSSFSINGTANLSVSYRVQNGGSFTTVSSGNVYAIPNDNTFRNYIFYYSPVFGYGALLVNDVEVWNNDGPDNTPMYWTASDNVTLGAGCDGSGSNRAFFDNLIIAEITMGPLPVELLNFRANDTREGVSLTWSTASETNNNYFTIERSENGKNWESIFSIEGAGNSSQTLNYSHLDKLPLEGVSYYRIKQTDFDGTSDFSIVQSVNRKNKDLNNGVHIYPNPTTNGLVFINLNNEELNEIEVFNSQGQRVTSKVTFSDSEDHVAQMDLSLLNKGIYLIKTDLESFRVIYK